MAKDDPAAETSQAAKGGVKAPSPNPRDKGRPEGGGEGHAPAADPRGATREEQTPGPRNPTPVPPANADGFVEVRSVEGATAQALSDDPTPPPDGKPPRIAGKSG